MSRVIFSKNARCSEMSKDDGELDFFAIFKNPLSSDPLNLDILTELEKDEAQSSQNRHLYS